VLPLSSLLKKTFPWSWTSSQASSFLRLKAALQQAPVLCLLDFQKPFEVTTNASGVCCGGMLTQHHDGADLPVAYYSKKLPETESHWPTHEKELYAIKLALDKWRHYLFGRPFNIFTDNSASKWFMNHPKLSGKMLRWLEFFSQFVFTLHHISGPLSRVADVLSRPPSAPQPLPSSLDTALTVSTATVHSCTTEYPLRADILQRHRSVRISIASYDLRDVALLVDVDFFFFFWGGSMGLLRQHPWAFTKSTVSNESPRCSM
jgi:hypothetical protein